MSLPNALKASQEFSISPSVTKDRAALKKEIENRLKDAQRRLDEEKQRRYPWE